MICWTLHYAKRILETLFVHRFSHATMPLNNLFKVKIIYIVTLVMALIIYYRTAVTTGVLLPLYPITLIIPFTLLQVRSFFVF